MSNKLAPIGKRISAPSCNYWGVWFIVSYGFGVLFVDLLDTIAIGGFKLGFWFAQQGSMYIFLILIFVYAKRMNTIDEKYDVNE